MIINHNFVKPFPNYFFGSLLLHQVNLGPVKPISFDDTDKVKEFTNFVRFVTYFFSRIHDNIEVISNTLWTISDIARIINFIPQVSSLYCGELGINYSNEITRIRIMFLHLESDMLLIVFYDFCLIQVVPKAPNFIITVRYTMLVSGEPSIAFNLTYIHKWFKYSYIC